MHLADFKQMESPAHKPFRKHPWTKICGITCLEDALLACRLGANALGFVLYPPSPRSVGVERARLIIQALPSNITKVGVVVGETPERIAALADYCALDVIQWHGIDHCLCTPSLNKPVWRAVRPQSEKEVARWAGIDPTVLLVDAHHPKLHGGSGQTANWNWAYQLGKRHAVILAGGLNASNIAQAVAQARPQGIDLSSSLERTPGRKDPAKLETFFAALKKIPPSPT